MDSTLNVVACQLSLAFYDVYALFDSRATYSLSSIKLTLSISSDNDRTSRILRTSLLSGEILLSEFFLRQIPITINGVTLKVNLIAIEMKDFDVIFRMNFLRKHNTIIDCYQRKVTFRPESGKKFDFKQRSLLNSKMIISSMQAQRMQSSRCMGFLVSAVDKSKEEKLDPTNVSVVKEFVEVFPEELLGLPNMGNFF